MPTISSSFKLSCFAVFLSTFLCAIIASIIWLPTVNTGFKLVIGSWKIIEILFPLKSCSSLIFISRIFLPLKRISPSTILPGGCFIRRRIERAVTLFPEPVSPTMPSVSMTFKSKETPSTAFTTPPSV